MRKTSKTIQTLRSALGHAENFLSELDSCSVASQANLSELRERFDTHLRDEGRDPEEVINKLAEASRDGLLGCASGRFYAWVIGGALPSALAADWLVTTWDQNAALYATGPAVAVIEEIAGEWLKEILSLPQEASVAFTTGCQLAHFTGLSAARYAVLKTRGWDVNQDGLFGAPIIRLLTSKHRHHSIDRASRFLGIGSNNIHSVEVDENECICPEAFKNALTESDQPTIVVLDAADLNVAAFDPFEELIPLAKAAGAWVHVDGAFGLISRASKKHFHKTQGVELADSWATDGHKWLNVPFDCGIAFVRDREAHRHAMTISASYIAPEGEARDQIDWNPEWSRKARGVPIYAALQELGRSGLEKLIDDSCRFCKELVNGIGKLNHAEVVWLPTLNQGLVRFIHPKADATDEEHDWMTKNVIQKVNESGVAFFSGTEWKGRHAMRVSVVNWRTSSEDIKMSIDAVSTAIESSKAEQDAADQPLTRPVS